MRLLPRTLLDYAASLTRRKIKALLPAGRVLLRSAATHSGPHCCSIAVRGVELEYRFDFFVTIVLLFVFFVNKGSFVMGHMLLSRVTYTA